jgi:hypothetical protein
MHKFPEGTATTAAIATAALNARPELLVDVNEYHVLWQTLANAARQAAEAPEPDWPTVKALWLMSDACSLMLRGDSGNEPFGPFMTWGQNRSAAIEDFTGDDATLFSQVAEIVPVRILRARLSDIAWLCARPKKNINDARRTASRASAAGRPGRRRPGCG